MARFEALGPLSKVEAKNLSFQINFVAENIRLLAINVDYK